MEQKIEKKVNDKSVINSQLIPLSVSSCVKLDKGLITKIFDMRTNELITKLIDWLFVIVCAVYVEKLNHLKSFFRGKSEEELNKIDTSLKTIIVLGFKFISF